MRSETEERQTPEFSGEMPPQNSDVISSREMRHRLALGRCALVLLRRRHDVAIFACENCGVICGRVRPYTTARPSTLLRLEGPWHATRR